MSHAAQYARVTLNIGGTIYTPGQPVSPPDLAKMAPADIKRLCVEDPTEGHRLRGEAEAVTPDAGNHPGGDTVQTARCDLDPAGLEGKSLDELNMMLEERKQGAASSVEEAIGILSAEFDPDKKPEE